MYHFGDGELNTDWLKPQGSPAQLIDLLATEQALLAYYQKDDGADPEKAAAVEKRSQILQEQLQAHETSDHHSGDGSGEPDPDRPDSRPGPDNPALAE